MKHKFFLLFACFLFSFNFSFAQVVNVESLRMKTNDLSTLLLSNINFSYSNNNGYYFYNIGAGIGATFKSKNRENVYFVVGNYNLIRSENEDFQNNWFIHLRYNHEFTNLLRAEMFAQSQENQVLDVNSRNLIGAGLRLKFVFLKASDTDKNDTGIRFYLGNAYMYEIEKSDAINTSSINHRHSSYFSLSGHIPKTALSVTNTLYYQPLYKNFSDYRLTNQLQFNIALNAKQTLSFNTTFNYSYDSNTPLNRSEFSSYIKFGFGIRLDSSKNKKI
jgi:hypothetical protein